MKNKTAASLAILFALIILGTWGNLWSITNAHTVMHRPKTCNRMANSVMHFGSLNAFLLPGWH